MLRPETYKIIASQACLLASVATGDGEYGLAHSLRSFEQRYTQLAEIAYAQQAEELRAGVLRVRLDMMLLDELHKRLLITHEEYTRYRMIVETMDAAKDAALDAS